MDIDGFVKPVGKLLTIGGDPNTPIRVKGVTFRPPKTPARFYESWDPDEIKHCLQAAENLGANVLRAWLPAKLEGSELDALREFVHMVRDHGMKLYGVINWPQLYADEGSAGDEDNIAYLGRLTAELAGETTIFGWDLANEGDWISDEHWQWAMEPATAAKRLEWFSRMTDLLHSLDSNHLVSMGATLSYSYWKPEEPFTLESFVDIVDFHFYHRNYRSSSLADEIAEVRRHTEKPILIGEIGFSTDPKFKTKGEPVHNEEVQRVVYAEALDVIRDSSECVGFIQWTLADYEQPTAPPEEQFYGILRSDLSRKPAADVFAARMSVEGFPKPEHRH